MTLYERNAMRNLLAQLRNLQLEPVVMGGEELPDLYHGLLSMNDANTAGTYLISADDMEHGELVQIMKPAAQFLLKGPEMMRQLLEENAEMRERIALTDWEPRAL